MKTTNLSDSPLPEFQSIPHEAASVSVTSSFHLLISSSSTRSLHQYSTKELPPWVGLSLIHGNLDFETYMGHLNIPIIPS